MSIRSRLITLLFLPVLIFLWFLGWSLYWIGEESQSRGTLQSIDDGISIVTGLYEEAVIKAEKQS